MSDSRDLGDGAVYLYSIANDLEIGVDRLYEAILRVMLNHGKQVLELRIAVKPPVLPLDVFEVTQESKQPPLKGPLPDVSKFFKSMNMGFMESVWDFLKQGKRIDAIKLIREAYMMKFGEAVGLKDTKDFCEGLMLELQGEF